MERKSYVAGSLLRLFVDTLYSRRRAARKRCQKIKFKAANRHQFACFSFFVFISLFVLYFTELSFPLQMTILAAFVVLLISLAIYFSKKGFFLPFLYVAAAVLFLILTVEWHEKIWGENSNTLYGLLFLHCIIWWITGRKLGQIYFTISAWLGIILLIVFISI
ncbi:hypothetical protein [Bacillus sp. PK3_68]|uniref:hypothetical protein n=1 Tax=Bacillus sp. PK3_68 TaxID=2027408 RepID=UPI000E727AB5|nr:hypothetical protein [Bacillus sp. PK3_68]RJS59717.1 hypothetical protein CJ483_06270 [Bacillus sp. PK3_68]